MHSKQSWRADGGILALPIVLALSIEGFETSSYMAIEPPSLIALYRLKDCGLVSRVLYLLSKWGPAEKMLYLCGMLFDYGS